MRHSRPQQSIRIVFDSDSSSSLVVHLEKRGQGWPDDEHENEDEHGDDNFAPKTRERLKFSPIRPKIEALRHFNLNEHLRMKTNWATRTARTLIAMSSLIASFSLHADEGMWLFNNPPRDQIRERYGFDVTDPWLEHVQKASVRFNSGGSGSFVSPDGLSTLR